MCRNIKPLFNFDPHVTDAEIQAAATQFVRKISGFTKPAKVNELAFEEAVASISAISSRLLGQLQTQAEPKNREVEAARARERFLKNPRFPVSQ